MYSENLSPTRLKRAGLSAVSAVVLVLGSSAFSGADEWSMIPSLSKPVANHNAILLLDGTLLVFENAEFAEIYDSDLGRWFQAGSEIESVGPGALLPDGRVLVADPFTPLLFDPVSRTWSEVSSPPTDTSKATATLLMDGRLLLVGGVDAAAASAAVTAFDPMDDSWHVLAPMNVARLGHCATRLTDGRVLVTGGHDDGSDPRGPFASAEVFDPQTGIWSLATQMGTARMDHTSTLLSDGHVLVVGGYEGIDGFPINTCELFDPRENSWSYVEPLEPARIGHSAVLLPDGQVAVIGGWNSPGRIPLWDTQFFDPALDRWSAGAELNFGRHWHTATLMPSGGILVVGGAYDGSGLFHTAMAEYWKVDSNQNWAPGPEMAESRFDHATTLLGDGRLMVSGGHNAPTPEILDMERFVWSLTTAMYQPRYDHEVILLSSGEVLAIGGRDQGGGTPMTSCELFDPGSNVWRSVGSMGAARSDHTATLLQDGRVLVAGGRPSARTTEVFDPATESWSFAGDLNTGRFGHSATLLVDGRVLVVGGWNFRDSFLPSAEIFDPRTGTWAQMSGLKQGRYWHNAELLDDGKVLVFGGSTNPYAAVPAEVFDPATGAWSDLGEMHHPRTNFAHVKLPNGNILAIGGGVESVESFDPLTGGWDVLGWNVERGFGLGATLLPDSRIVLTGGREELSTTEILEPFLVPAERRPIILSRPPAIAENLSATMAPTCGDSTSLCDSGSGLLGRDSVVGGQEPNQPNTINSSCQDGSSGTFHVEGSIDRIRVFSANGSRLALGSRAWVEVTFWAADADNVVDVYSAEDAYSPDWIFVDTLEPRGPGLSVLSTSITLSDSSNWQAVRAHQRMGGSPAPCGSGTTDDHDDIAFYVDSVAGSGSDQMRFGEPYSITGVRFGGDSEASSGSTQNSPVNYPLVRMSSLEGGVVSWLRPDPLPHLSADPMTLTFSRLPDTLHPGWHKMTVIAAGVPSEAVMVNVMCGVVIVSDPTDQRDVPVGQTVTFSVDTQGAEYFQWRKCVTASCSAVDWYPIEGVEGATFTTPTVVAQDSGTKYRVEVRGACFDPELACEAQPDGCVVSETATLTVEDNDDPIVDVVSPNGGEYWVLSDESPDVPANPEFVTWSMSDDVRICSFEVTLEYSDDSGQTWSEAPAGGGLPASFGPGGTCVNPGVETTSLVYEVPAEPPSGSSGSLYRIRVEAVDHAGNTTVAYSERPFYVVRANPETVNTLILADPERMQDGSVMGSDAISLADAEALTTKLYELAGHPRVQGFVADLGAVSSLQAKLGEWDQGTITANEVLFGDGGLHDYLLEELLPVYSGVEYVVLVGDDRVIPFSRLTDGASLHTEDTYVAGGDLGGGSTVGEALASGHYLSDDPLSVLDTVRPGDLADSIFVPDLAVGRLVERPEEITATIATFISQDGFLDLVNHDPDDDHRVLVTSYDFLLDSGRRIRERWKSRLGVSTGDESTAPVNGSLITPDWGGGSVGDRQDALESNLGGLGGLHYGIASLNGHATHYEEGVPGTDPHDINGLSSDRIGALDLAGAVVYAVGCHGGLTVPGSGVGDSDNSLDLPQTFLGRGAVSYLANTGYGWGLKHGVGYSERLVELFTQELTGGGTVTVGDAFIRSKQRYVLESTGINDYDTKSLMQWAHYGLPMYAVSTGISTAKAMPSLAAAVGGGQTGSVVVREVESKAFKKLPSYLTRLDLQFDLSAEGLYTKYDADGEVVESPGCRHANGCYYTIFNGLVNTSTGSSDVPLQPMLLYDSRLAGTSQHGVLWKGGSYIEEGGWKAVIGELVSNGGDGSDHGSTPRKAIIRPTSRRVVGGRDPEECRPSDLELNGLVLGAGEAVKADVGDLEFTVERLYREIDLETFYYNNTGEPANNCDRSGPLLGEGPFGDDYHQTDGDTLWWEIPASDEAGVWRVVVVATDNTVDGQGLGTWVPVELEDGDGDGHWTGEMGISGTDRLTYVVQAVDNRGNVSWLDFVSTQPPVSGVDPGLPLPVDVEAGANDSLIFADGFEGGGHSNWSDVVP